MARTTIDLDSTVLRELKDRGQREGKSVGQLASELLARALADRGDSPPPRFEWRARRMGARVDLADKDAVYRLLDEG